MITDAVERFLSLGGKVQQVAGFEYRPLPEYRPPKKRKAVQSCYAPAPRVVDAALHKCANYAKKQRNKRELRKTWTV